MRLKTAITEISTISVNNREAVARLCPPAMPPLGKYQGDAIAQPGT